MTSLPSTAQIDKAGSMETIDAYIYLHEQGWPVDQLQVSIYPREEQYCEPYGLSVDIRFDDINGVTHLIHDEDRVKAILADIKAHDSDKWSEIERAARLNSRPDYEDPYAPYYAEDILPTLEIPR